MVLPQLDCGKMGRWGLSTKTSRLASGGLSPRRQRSTPASIVPRMTGRDSIWVTILFTNHRSQELLPFDPPVLTLFSLLLELAVTYGIHEIRILLTVGWIHSPAFLTSKGGWYEVFHFPQTKRLINESCAPVLMKGIRSIQLTCHMRDLTTLARRGRVLDFLVATWFCFFCGTSASTLWISPRWIPLALEMLRLLRGISFQFDVSLTVPLACKKWTQRGRIRQFHPDPAYLVNTSIFLHITSL